jgi:hypothetical protein
LKYLLPLFISLLFIDCENGPKPEADKDDIILAEVGNRKLYQSKIKDLFSSNIDSLEKQILIKGFVSNWIREQLLIIEAESKMADSLDIDELVDTYRSSLILDYYENKLVSQLLDTVITEQQLKDYYNTYKKEFILLEPIAKGICFSINANDDTKKLRKAYQEEDMAEIFKLGENLFTSQVIEPNKWQPINQLRNKLPDKHFKTSKLLRKGDHSKKFGSTMYYVKILDIVEKNEVPPLDYIESKIKRIIFNNRKKALIKRKKQQLYDQNYNNNKIKIYLD